MTFVPRASWTSPGSLQRRRRSPLHDHGRRRFDGVLLCGAQPLIRSAPMNDTGDRQKPTGLTRMFRAFGASMKGFSGAYREEAAFRQELALAVVVIPLGLWLGRNGVERVLLIAPMFLVLIVELVNSAIEATVDRIGLERHKLSGLAKDIGSAAVLTSLLLLAVIWILILWR